ncbi:reverse transcriptase domain-containing protein [Veillonella parvula]|uniref:reverse transcriptase domain-containing protein n=1 Tax=Veillonella parvula TaxID=29466 RepID=UPI0026EDF77B|nr:reverse transcriptase domain-containing protein [Veillonella parvula]
MSQIDYNLLQSIIDIQSNLFKISNNNSSSFYPTIDNLKKAIKEENINFNGQKKHFILTQHTKKRFGYKYDKNSLEYIVCLYLKKRIDKEFKIIFPNRNKIIKSLFGTLTLLKNMQDFTIYKFDFKDFFNSISNDYVNQNYLKDSNLSRAEKALITQYCNCFKYTFSGLSLSNTLCELVARDFDNILTQKLKDLGIIFYQRYIDDCLIISNINIKEDSLKKIIEEAISSVFYKDNINIKCKVKLNPNKFNYISKYDLNQLKELKFLGYQINFEPESNPDKIKLTYGITKEKIIKYQNKLNHLIADNIKNELSDEILRQKIKAFCHRIVYLSTHKNNIIWKSKGIIANYTELQYYLAALIPDTKTFLENAVKDAFNQNNLPLPYYLKSSNNTYTLLYTLQNKKSMIFVECLGYNLKTLKKLARKIGLRNMKGLTYNQILGKYLIALKVGF